MGHTAPGQRTSEDEPPLVQIVWTRAVDGEPMAGRLRVANAVRRALSEHARVREHVMVPVIASQGFRGLLRVMWRYLANLVVGRLLPLQCAMYAEPAEMERALAAIDPSADAIYLDGVRTYPLLEQIRARFPDTRIVVDLDDLMSRRMRLLRAVGEPLSPGYLMRNLPRPVVAGLLGPIGKLVCRYEAATLPAVEQRICALADAVVLLSSSDMDELPTTGRARHVTIPPTCAIKPDPAWPRSGPLRFIFVGTDALTQNRLTIDYLVALWRRRQIATPLTIYGLQNRALDLPPGVTTPGYARTLEEIYDGRSVLLSPSFLPGGIKTKVLEAFAHGAPVIGSHITFEAMPIGEYPLKIDNEEDLVALLRAPEAQRERLDRAVAAGRTYLARHHSPERFTEQWLAVMGIEHAPTPAQMEAAQ